MNDVNMTYLQDLKSYLLGQAQADETERLDELSITSDEFAQALEAAEIDLLDSYVNGELSAADRAKFEDKYLQSRDQIERIAFANALQEFASSRLSARPVAVAVTGGGFALFGLSVRFFQFGLAAAVLLLAIGGGWFFISRSSQNLNETAAVHDEPVKNAQVGQPQMTATNAENTQIRLPANDEQKEKEKSERPPKETKPPVHVPRIVAVVLSPQLRSATEPRKVEIPADTDQFSARLELEAGDFRSYRAVLRERSSNRTIWESNAVRATGPANARRLAVSVPARLLNSAIYIFTVSGISRNRTADNGTAEIVGDYSFTVVR